MGRSVDIMNLPSNKYVPAVKKIVATSNHLGKTYNYWFFVILNIFSPFCLLIIIIKLRWNLFKWQSCKNWSKCWFPPLPPTTTLLPSSDLQPLKKYRRFFSPEISSSQEPIAMSMKSVESTWEWNTITLLSFSTEEKVFPLRYIVIHISPPIIGKLDLEYIVDPKREPMIIRPKLEDMQRFMVIINNYLGEKYNSYAVGQIGLRELKCKLKNEEKIRFSQGNLKYSRICSDSVLYALIKASPKI